MSKTFYITTPIYYVNARPHIGHAYTTIACDTIARRQRMMGYDTYFLTGTDEHGQKIERAAQAAGKTPQQLTTEVAAEFRALWDRLGLTYDDFIRTTSERHKQGVQTLWRKIRDNGHIYRGQYIGQYCVFDVIYVWMDALANYITALGYGSDDTKLFEKFWPANLQMIGKEIVRFHCVYWPAFLMAAGLPLPQRIHAHGWLLFEENKMSKSRGNIVRAETIVDVLGADALRYFLLREVVFGQDGSFSFDALVQRYNADLANGLGNLASRTLTMITRYFRGEVPYPSRTSSRKPADDAVAQSAAKLINEYNSLFEDRQFSRALEAAWGLVASVDKYIVENEPWDLGEKQDEESRARLATVLCPCAESLRIVTALAHPVIPEATAKIWTQLGLGEIKKYPLQNLRWGQLHLGTKLGKIEPVFPRADKSAVERMRKMEDEGRTAAVATETRTVLPEAPPAVGTQAAVSPQASATAPDGKISIDEFAKVELRVGQVKLAEKVKGADKLLRLEVDLGTEVRQVVAGIAEAYAPETLIGRKVVIVVNLAPRKLRGLESNGMIVAASPEGGKPVLCSFLEDVPVGTRLK